MTIHPHTQLLSPSQRSAVALGTFDGLHLGHRQVIGQVLTSEYTPTVLAVLPGEEKKSSWLVLPSQKEALLDAMGVKRYVPTPLEDIMHLSAEAFFYTYLKERLRARMIACGFNFRFGKDAAGDVTLLQQLCRQNNIALQVSDPVVIHGQPVSSTRIRQALTDGDPTLAARLLGRPFGFTAPVEKGRQLGRTIGFPTINQAIPTSLFLPKLGVYGVLVTIEEHTYIGVCNIGLHPTVGNAKVPLAETYILDYTGDAYGKPVHTQLMAYLRPERTFGSLEELSQAIWQDARRARTMATMR